MAPMIRLFEKPKLGWMAIVVLALVAAVLVAIVPAGSAHAAYAEKHCGSFQARYKIHVFAEHMSCRKARRIQKEYWLAPESEKELVGPDEYNGYIRLKRFPGWHCTSGAMAGACVKGRQAAGYSTYNP
jgi:hypothetical protein